MLCALTVNEDYEPNLTEKKSLSCHALVNKVVFWWCNLEKPMETDRLERETLFVSLIC